MNAQTQAAFDILVVEDNDFDVKRFSRALARIEAPYHFERAVDGQDALNVLRRGLPDTDQPTDVPPADDSDTRTLQRPFVIFLDLNMPVMGGLEFLDALRADPKLAKLPVVVITTSEFYKDVERAHAHNVCGYIVKPVSGEEMVDVTVKIIAYLEKCIIPI